MEPLGDFHQHIAVLVVNDFVGHLPDGNFPRSGVAFRLGAVFRERLAFLFGFFLRGEEFHVFATVPCDKVLHVALLLFQRYVDFD
jgi:hypothetical protein